MEMGYNIGGDQYLLLYVVQKSVGSGGGSILINNSISLLGFDQLCWHNFRIIGTNFGGISIEHNASIIGSDLPI